MMHLLPGSTIPHLDEDRLVIGNVNYLFLGISLLPEISGFSSQLEETARFYLNTPYLWGGRSLFGMDCSGFVQVIYKHFGVKVSRDAYQQAEEGHIVNALQDVKPGDLAFFDNEEGKISHVGIPLGSTEIIGRASCRERVCQYVWLAVVAVSLK